MPKLKLPAHILAANPELRGAVVALAGGRGWA